MNASLRIGLFAVLLSAGAAYAEPLVVRVAATAELRLAVVDAARATRARETLHEAFATSLGEAIGEMCGDPVAVKMKSVGADHAAFGLNAGTYDVVLVIAKSLPRQLAMGDTCRLTATLGMDQKAPKAFLIFGGADEGLQKLLTKSFASAISNTRFLDALDGGIDANPESIKGKKLAAR